MTDEIQPIEQIHDAESLLGDFGYGPAIGLPPPTTGTRHPQLPDVNIKLLDHYGDDIPKPAYQSALASGFDIAAVINEPVFLNTIGASAKIPTGISLEIPVGYEVQCRTRSGMAAKSGIVVTNSPGTIDADYRGEIFVLLTNLHGRRFTVTRGMRIAQLVICPVVQGQLNFTDVLSETERGDGAFGSTGVE